MAAAPANDDVQSAQVITPVLESGFMEARITGTNGLATAQTDEPHRIASGGGDRSTVWYSWTPSYGHAGAFIQLCADFNPFLGIYTKNADPVPPFSNLTESFGFGSDNPSQACPDSVGGGYGGLVSLGDYDAGQTFYFQVGGWRAFDSGPFRLNLEQFPASDPDSGSTPPPTSPPGEDDSAACEQAKEKVKKLKQKLKGADSPDEKAKVKKKLKKAKKAEQEACA
jgi:hypothetical protein